MQETSMLRPRQECVACSAHTYGDACNACGSMNLRKVIPGPEDIRRVGDLPLSTKALRAMSVRLAPESSQSAQE